MRLRYGTVSEARGARPASRLVGGIAGSLLALALLSLIVVALDPAFQDVDTGTEWLLPVLNALPVLAACLLVLALTRRPLLSLWLGAVVLALLYGINALKLEHLETPLLPADFMMLTTPRASAGLLRHYLPASVDAWAPWLGVMLVTAGLARWERPWRGSGGRRRSLPLLAAGLVVVTLVTGVQPWRLLYAQEKVAFVPWSPRETVSNIGLVAGLLRFRWQYSEPVPTPDRAAAAALLAQMPAGTAPRPPPAALPDIVIVQSESFFDPGRLQGLQQREHLPHYRRLAREAIHGDLWVPAFGGGTIRTEFEVLTGLAMRHFPQNEYPYFQLVGNGLPGLVSVLAAQGYRSLALHPNDPAFWNRAAALKNLGIERFESEADFAGAPRDGFFVSDQALAERIVERLPDSGPPQLIVAISMELHGPYDASKPLAEPRRRDAIEVPARLRPASAGRLRTFLYHLGNADRALGWLADALRQRERRTLLLFYGDHLPGLPITFETLGFVDGHPPHQQPVPWLLLDSAAPQAAREDSASFMLPGRLLALLGIDDPWFALTEKLRQETVFGPAFVPAGDAGLAALSQLRQRGEQPPAVEAATEEAAAAPSAAAAAQP